MFCPSTPKQLHRLGRGFPLHLAQFRHRRQKGLGVVMLRVFENLFDRALFDLVATEHDDNAVGHLCDHSHVMGDEHHRSARFALQTVHKRQNFSLNGHVQGGRRLVGNQQTRLAGHRHCNHHALTHAA